jgi:hypothetical protein
MLVSRFRQWLNEVLGARRRRQPFRRQPTCKTSLEQLEELVPAFTR